MQGEPPLKHARRLALMIGSSPIRSKNRHRMAPARPALLPRRSAHSEQPPTRSASPSARSISSISSEDPITPTNAIGVNIKNLFFHRCSYRAPLTGRLRPKQRGALNGFGIISLAENSKLLQLNGKDRLHQHTQLSHRFLFYVVLFSIGHEWRSING